ncbi:hypothetical protein ACFOHS_06565 [Jhaorihella thermophila]
MLRDRSGIIDISNFARYRVVGAEVEDWRNAVFANRMPVTAGRSCLALLIGWRGGIAGDFYRDPAGRAGILSDRLGGWPGTVTSDCSVPCRCPKGRHSRA